MWAGKVGLRLGISASAMYTILLLLKELLRNFPLLFFLYVSRVSDCMYAACVQACRGQKKPWDPLEMEVQVLRHHVGAEN